MRHVVVAHHILVHQLLLTLAELLLQGGVRIVVVLALYNHVVHSLPLVEPLLGDQVSFGVLVADTFASKLLYLLKFLLCSFSLVKVYQLLAFLLNVL